MVGSYHNRSGAHGFLSAENSVYKIPKILIAPGLTQQRVTGTVSLKLYKGNIAVASRASDHALYDERFVTFGADDVYQQSDAGGFIRLFGLSQRVRALKDQELAKRSAEQPVPAEAATDIVEDRANDIALAVA